MTDTIRMRVTAVAEYEAHPSHYNGETDPAAMAEIDMPHAHEILLDNPGAAYTIEPVNTAAVMIDTALILDCMERGYDAEDLHHFILEHIGGSR